MIDENAIMEKLQRDGVMFNWPLYEAEILSRKECELTVIENRIKAILKIPELFSLYPELVLKQALKNGVCIKSFSLEWLKGQQNDEPLFPILVEWKILRQFLKTYGDDLQLRLAETSRLHPTWLWNGTITNRIVAKDPCIQNFPRVVREYFTAPQGSQIISADYSQMELRVMAEISGDVGLQKIFGAGGDLYRSIAAAIFNIGIDAVDDDKRQISKAITLGMLFGITSHGITENLKEKGLSMTKQEANNLQLSFFKQFPKVGEFQRKMLTGETIKTLGGFEFHNIEKAGSKLAMPIQGSSSEIFKKAIELLVERLDPDVKIVCLLHDEIFVEAPREKIQAVKEILKNAMVEGAQKYIKSVPIIINFKESKEVLQMLNTNDNSVVGVEEVVINGNLALSDQLNKMEKVTIEDLLEPDSEHGAENVWISGKKENPLLKGINPSIIQKTISPFAFVVKELLPPDGSYHFRIKNYEEQLNSVRPGGYVSSYCTFDITLLSIDNIEFELKQVFSDKELSLKLFQGFINSLLNCLRITEIGNPRELIGCSGECTIKNSFNDGRRYANISEFIQAELPKKELK